MLTLLTPQPAALVETEQKKTLVIADPHLGWEMALQEKGIHVPSQTPKILEKLNALLDEQEPDALLVLGDVKYTVFVSELGEWHDIPNFFNGVKKHVAEVSVVRGNHDANLEPMLPEDVIIHPATGIALEDVGLFHGHKWPSPSLLGCKTLVMGHLHPVVSFLDPAGFKLSRQCWIRADLDAPLLAKVLLAKHGVKVENTIEETLQKHYKTRLKTTQLFLMPSFNDFLGGRSVNEAHLRKGLAEEVLIGPVLRSEAINMGNSELYLLDGTYLGTLNQLRNLP